jgi:ATP-dependent DNA ligase
VRLTRLAALLDIHHDVAMRSSFSFEPMLCQNAKPLPEGREWRYELKLDGFRAMAERRGAPLSSGRATKRISHVNSRP